MTCENMNQKRDTYWARIEKWLFPIVSVYLVAGYIHWLQYLSVFETISSNLILFILFIPVVIFEFFVTRRFYHLQKVNNDHDSWKSYLLAFAANVSFWFVLFLFWVLLMSILARANPGIKLYCTNFYPFVFILLRAMILYALAGITLWIATYYFLTVRLKRLRIASCILLPIVILALLFLHQFYFAGIGGTNSNLVTEQNGVSLILDKFSLQAAIDKARSEELVLLAPPPKRFVKRRSIEILYHSRNIFFDEKYNALFVTVGCTYCMEKPGWNSPMLIRKDMTTGNMKFLFGSNNIRQIDHTDDSIFFAPWKDGNIYEVAKSNLDIITAIPKQVPKSFYWEPMSVIKDIEKNQLIIGNEIQPAVLFYDQESEKLVDMLDLHKMGSIRAGGTANSMVQANNSRKLYFIALPGKADLFELDLDTRKITRTLDLGNSIGTALIMDQENEYLYFQSGIYNTLSVVDIPSWKVIRRYKSEFHARRLALDKKRNVIYVLGYVSGTVFPIDLESGKKIWTVDVGGRAHGLDLTNDTLWVHSAAGAFKIDLDIVWNDWENAKALEQ